MDAYACEEPQASRKTQENKFEKDFTIFIVVNGSCMLVLYCCFIYDIGNDSGFFGELLDMYTKYLADNWRVASFSHAWTVDATSNKQLCRTTSSLGGSVVVCTSTYVWAVEFVC